MSQIMQLMSSYLSIRLMIIWNSINLSNIKYKKNSDQRTQRYLISQWLNKSSTLKTLVTKHLFLFNSELFL